MLEEEEDARRAAKKVKGDVADQIQAANEHRSSLAGGSQSINDVSGYHARGGPRPCRATCDPVKVHKADKAWANVIVAVGLPLHLVDHCRFTHLWTTVGSVEASIEAGPGYSVIDRHALADKTLKVVPFTTHAHDTRTPAHDTRARGRRHARGSDTRGAICPFYTVF